MGKKLTLISFIEDCPKNPQELFTDKLFYSIHKTPVDNH